MANGGSTTQEMLGRFEGEPDYSDPSGDDFEALARDRIPVRTLRAEDLPALVRIDRRITGCDRSAYYRRKVREALDESGVRVSLVAEQEGEIAGFVMARVDYGEFGRTDTAAVIDTLGVDPAYVRRGVGYALLSQLLANLAALRVETVRTEIAWNERALGAFLERCGFAPGQRLALTKRLA
ncbi:GNAT family N-acetyltransferase [Inmirania thermothiophila]|uniref:Ribosomal protein S18 acetylase RimI-like enzyme n=1 Tax=Inmirania thermothiophila TaxID=1750597 RepID=A0A3N1Y0X4_9GAMM|nr:GNAT family N-acetyltransferase [Inmirania thermothiophila]ROR32475.1 ribosomal protein S18 acetylase RimI-like enzyme [Inmirania thermothiophila]